MVVKYRKSKDIAKVSLADRVSTLEDTAELTKDLVLETHTSSKEALEAITKKIEALSCSYNILSVTINDLQAKLDFKSNNEAALPLTSNGEFYSLQQDVTNLKKVFHGTLQQMKNLEYLMPNH